MTENRDLVFKDKLDNEYEIIWKNTDVTICGFFRGNISNIHERIYANLGYNNTILGIKNITTNQVFYLNDIIEFKEPKTDLDKNYYPITKIKIFYINSFNSEIGFYSYEAIGRIELNEVLQLNEVKEVFYSNN